MMMMMMMMIVMMMMTMIVIMIMMMMMMIMMMMVCIHSSMIASIAKEFPITFYCESCKVATFFAIFPFSVNDLYPHDSKETRSALSSWIYAAKLVSLLF